MVSGTVCMLDRCSPTDLYPRLHMICLRKKYISFQFAGDVRLPSYGWKSGLYKKILTPENSN